MSPHIRRIIYVVTYELIAILVVTGALGFEGGLIVILVPIFAWLFDIVFPPQRTNTIAA